MKRFPSNLYFSHCVNTTSNLKSYVTFASFGYITFVFKYWNLVQVNRVVESPFQSSDSGVNVTKLIRSMLSLFNNNKKLPTGLEAGWGSMISREAGYNDTNALKEKNLWFKIASAESYGRLAIGIEEVMIALYKHQGKLLIAERSYLFPSPTSRQQIKTTVTQKQAVLQQYEDPLEVVIERLLNDDGDLDFVNSIMPKKYKRMVMILND
jgi:hypothetical protein